MDPRPESPTPMLAKPAEPAAETAHHKASGGIAEVDAQSMLEEVRTYLQNGMFRDAQRVAREAMAVFPDDPVVGRAHHALNDRQVKNRPSTGRDTTRDFEWLKDPPPAARGKWVALAGDEALALGANLTELVESLSAEDLSKKPLLVRLD